MLGPINMEEVFDAVKAKRDAAQAGGYTFYAEGATMALRIICEAIAGMHPFSPWAGDAQVQARQCQRCELVEVWALSGPGVLIQDDEAEETTRRG